MNPGFDDLIDDGLDPAERERLRGVHELLVAAGPPPELTSTLANLAPEPAEAEVLRFPRRRRGLAALALAATVAVAAVGGYLIGDNGQGSFKTVRVVSMQGQNAFASVRVGPSDGNGNWPLEFSVQGLPKLTGDSYYELMLTQNGKPTLPCGVPYKLTSGSTWVVIVLTPKPGHRRTFTGPTVLT
jgi:hypothetical protein